MQPRDLGTARRSNVATSTFEDVTIAVLWLVVIIFTTSAMHASEWDLFAGGFHEGAQTPIGSPVSASNDVEFDEAPRHLVCLFEMQELHRQAIVGDQKIGDLRREIAGKYALDSSQFVLCDFLEVYWKIT